MVRDGLLVRRGGGPERIGAALAHSSRRYTGTWKSRSVPTMGMLFHVRALLRLLRGVRTAPTSGSRDTTTLDVAGICERWLADRDRVAWVRQRLNGSADRQQVGQTFCDVISAWSRELARQGVGLPEQQAAIVTAEFDEWTAAMQRYPWRSTDG